MSSWYTELLEEVADRCGTGKEALDVLERTKEPKWLSLMSAKIDEFPPLKSWNRGSEELIDVDLQRPGVRYSIFIGRNSVCENDSAGDVDRVEGDNWVTVAWYVRKGHYLAGLAAHYLKA
jgi:hypothetical protein